jgi:fatty acid amide hydrolase
VDTEPSAVAPPEGLERFGAAELARGIAAGRWSASDVVAAHIARIGAVDANLDAVVVRRFEAARVEAALADAAVREGVPLGPLHGVPITLKEQFALAGTPATIGVAGASDDAEDGPLVTRLRAAGAIVLGKTNVPQLLIYNEADNPVYGRTNNPWNLERSCGGSSGGEAAIIAACGSPLGLGSDIGGSLRCPSHACGIASLKPTTHRLTNEDARGSGFAAGQIAIVSQPGPMARRVEDLVLAMRVLAAPGQERFDAALPPVPWREPADVNVAGLRIGTYDDDGFFPSSPAVKRAVAESAAALRALGADVVSFAPPDVGTAIETFLAILAADGARGAKRRLGTSARDRRVTGLLQLAAIPNALRPTLVGVSAALDQQRLSRQIAAIRPSSTDGFWTLVEQQTAYRRRFTGELDRLGIDVILAPVHALPALTHGGAYYLSTAASYSMLYNLLGMPAGAVPVTRVRNDEARPRAVGRDMIDRAAAEVERGSAGLPIGVQVVARHWREDLVLAVMAELERSLSANPEYPDLPPVP